RLRRGRHDRRLRDLDPLREPAARVAGSGGGDPGVARAVWGVVRDPARELGIHDPGRHPRGGDDLVAGRGVAGLGDPHQRGPRDPSRPGPRLHLWRTEPEERATDDDPMVGALGIDGLSGSGSLERSVLARALQDEEAVVRLSAVEALTDGPGDPLLAGRLGPLEADPDPVVGAAMCVALLGGPFRPGAVERLARLLSDERTEVRAAVVRRLHAASADDVLTFASPMLEDRSPAVRTEALRALASAAPDTAFGPALRALEGQDTSLREAALDVLGGLDLTQHASTIGRVARERAALAQHDLALATAIPSDGAEAELLRTALLERGRSHAVVALSALSLVSRDRDAIWAALENLRGTEPGQLANALETP